MRRKRKSLDSRRADGRAYNRKRREESQEVRERARLSARLYYHKVRRDPERLAFIRRQNTEYGRLRRNRKARLLKKQEREKLAAVEAPSRPEVEEESPAIMNGATVAVKSEPQVEDKDTSREGYQACGSNNKDIVSNNDVNPEPNYSCGVASCSCGKRFWGYLDLRLHLLENTTHTDSSVSVGGFAKWKTGLPEWKLSQRKRPRPPQVPPDPLGRYIQTPCVCDVCRPALNLDSDSLEDGTNAQSDRFDTILDIGPMCVLKEEYAVDDDNGVGWEDPMRETQPEDHGFFAFKSCLKKDMGEEDEVEMDEELLLKANFSIVVEDASSLASALHNNAHEQAPQFRKGSKGNP